MKQPQFTPNELAELIPLARLAAAGPERENFWDQVGEFFESKPTKAAPEVEPRPTAENQ